MVGRNPLVPYSLGLHVKVKDVTLVKNAIFFKYDFSSVRDIDGIDKQSSSVFLTH